MRSIALVHLLLLSVAVVAVFVGPTGAFSPLNGKSNPISPIIRITIYSDIAVPWCYVAHKRLERAVQIHNSKIDSISKKIIRKDIPSKLPPRVKVKWRPFQHDPTIPEQGIPLEVYTKQRGNGSLQWTKTVKSRGRRDGALFACWPENAVWPNTLKVHQVIQFAQEKCGMDGMEASSVMFHAFYEEGLNICDIDVLLKIGVERLNLPAAPLREYLENDFGAEQIEKDRSRVKRMYNLQVLPFFIIVKDRSGDLPYTFAGAQSRGTCTKLFYWQMWKVLLWSGATREEKIVS